jgi:hypothetical protein
MFELWANLSWSQKDQLTTDHHQNSGDGEIVHGITDFCRRL